MAQPYIGSVIAVGFNFAPQGWLLCNGALYPISEYDTLYSLIGTTYGGDGATTFAVPDLRGRGVINQGQGPGLSSYTMGQIGGSEDVTVLTANMPSHAHLPMAAANGTTSTPSASVILGGSNDNTSLLYAAPASQTNLNNAVVGQSGGGSQPHDNMQPFNTVNYVIAALGIYPSQ